MKKPIRLIVFALVAVLAAAAGMTLARSLQGTPASTAADVRALVLEAPRTLPDFLLTDHQQQPFGPARFEGRWTLLFFGFTHCPDVCPTTLNTLAGLAQSLQDLPLASQPTITMISVDPMRDTAEKLSAYVPFFNPDFVGVTGEMGEVLTLTRGLGVAFAYTPGANGEAYTVEHTASVFLIDPAGRLAAIFSTPHGVAELDREYRQIVSTRG
ncbi:MAG: SCO family protein [Gammaproteobacteria bacterium]